MSSDESTTSSSSSGVSVQLREVNFNDLNDVFPPLQRIIRKTLFYITSSFVLFLFMLYPGNMFLSTLISVTYPMYASLLTLNTKNRSEYTQWLVYWCVFAVFCQFDFLFGSINGLLLLYVPTKTIFLLYLAICVKHIRKRIAMMKL